MNRTLVTTTVVVSALLSGCTSPELNQLRDENAALRSEVERLRSRPADGAPPQEELTNIQSFTVGLAASESDFDDAAFAKMLRENLDQAAQEKAPEKVRVTREQDPRQVHKIRGMLIQQYLAAEELPISITNLNFKLQDAKNVFKIGGQVVPVEGTALAAGGSGQAVGASFRPAISASMRRDTKGSYSIAYEEVGGGKGRLKIKIRDVDILDAEEHPRAVRQGDLSFNWRLNLEKIQVFRVENFQGDVGQFLGDMRYSAVHSTIGNYQTLRDFVFLFGYGRYTTGLVNQIRTPSNITAVEVFAIDPADFERLRGRLSEKDLLDICGSTGKWANCKFVEFADGKKVWERPSAIGFPFVSRQTDGAKKHVFYLKFDSKGTHFIADYRR